MREVEVRRVERNPIGQELDALPLTILEDAILHMDVGDIFEVDDAYDYMCEVLGGHFGEAMRGISKWNIERSLDYDFTMRQLERQVNKVAVSSTFDPDSYEYIYTRIR